MDGSGKRKAVQRMKDYVEEHIAEKITLRMLADAAGYSPWHTERVFKEVTGQTPFDYLRAVRLSRAAARLRDTDARIVDVAFDFVFGSHEGFTRAFSRHFGMTPQEYRKIAPLSRFFVPNPVRGYHLTRQRHSNREFKKCSPTFEKGLTCSAKANSSMSLVRWCLSACSVNALIARPRSVAHLPRLQHHALSRFIAPEHPCSSLPRRQALFGAAAGG